MVDIQSKEVIDKMSDELKIQPSMALPRALVNTIQPVYSVNPDHKKGVAISSGRAATGSGVVFATPAGKDFFLTSCHMSYMCDATADSTLYELRCNPVGNNGQTINVLRFNKLTTTAANQTQSIAIDPPLQLERGSSILIVQTFTVGTSNITGGITGYSVDPQ